MNNEQQTTNHLGEALIQKFVHEEIMTKTEFVQQLDRAMGKYVEHIDRKFDHIDQKFALVDKQISALKTDMDKRFEQVDKRFAQIDVRYNWIIGLIITATIGIVNIVIKIH